MGVSLSIEIKQNSQNVANNSSNVTVKTSVNWNNGSWNATGRCTGSITIDGKRYDFSGLSFNTNHTSTGSQVIMEKTVDVAHNSDGTKTVAASASFVTGTGSGTVTASGTKALSVIARATTPKLSSDTIEMGKKLTITLPRASGTFTHNVSYQFGDVTGIIATGATTSCEFNVPLDLANQIPKATSGWGSVICYTYSGNSLVGTKSVKFTATVPSDVVPKIINVAMVDPNGLEPIYGAYVQNKSKMSVTVDASGVYLSTIDKVEITVGGVKSTANPFTTNVLTEEGGQKYVSVTVTDSRGRKVSKAVPYTMYSYASPTISKLTASRCDEDGTANDEGAYIVIGYAGKVTDIASKGINAKTMSLKYKNQSVNEWISIVSLEQYTEDNSIIVEADTEKQFDIVFQISDSYSVAEKQTAISTAFTLMDFNTSGRGVAIGKVSQKDAFEVNMPTDLRQPVTLLGHDSCVGTIIDVNSKDAKSCPSGNWIGSDSVLDLSAGTWLLVYRIEFSPSAGKRRGCMIGQSTDGGNTYSNIPSSMVYVGASATSQGISVQGSCVVSSKVGSRVKLHGYQDTGSTIDMKVTNLRAVRLI